MASRDRRTKAQLLQELEELKQAFRRDTAKWKDLATRQNNLLDDVTEELEYFKSTSDTYERECNAFQKDLESVQEELEKVRRELSDRKERDRSPRRLSATTSRSRMEQTCKALTHVLAWERDPVIDEQKVAINKLTQEIEALRKGEGPIGEVLLRLKGDDPSDFTRERLLAERTPVYEAIRKLHKLVDSARDLTTWGQVSWTTNFNDIAAPRPF